jgi:hypothetical protein
MAVVGLKNLCSPAYVYFIFSMILLFVMVLQNFGNINTYCIGTLSCDVPSTVFIFVLKVIYILFWTWILNIICRAGYSGLSWFLVLLPLLLFFLLVASVFYWRF